MDYDFSGLKSETQDHIIKNYCTIAHDYYLRQRLIHIFCTLAVI